MARLKVDSREKSARACRVCGAALKAILVNRQPSAERCFKCHLVAELAAGHRMVTARDVRREPRLQSMKRYAKHIPVRTRQWV